MAKEKETTGHWLLRVLRKNFLTGFLIIVPLAIAVWILWWLFSSVDSLLQPLIALVFKKPIPGLGLAIFLVLIYIVGFIASNYVGRKMIQSVEKLLTKVPVFRQVYIGAKQVVEGFTGAGINKAAFREVVFVEFPRKGMTTLAFITNEVVDSSGRKLYAIYIPTAPVPTSGYFEMVTEEKITHTDISVDEGIKIVISSGMILPEKVSVGKKTVQAPQSIVELFHSTVKQQGNADDNND